MEYTPDDAFVTGRCR